MQTRLVKWNTFPDYLRNVLTLNRTFKQKIIPLSHLGWCRWKHDFHLNRRRTQLAVFVKLCEAVTTEEDRSLWPNESKELVDRVEPITDFVASRNDYELRQLDNKHTVLEKTAAVLAPVVRKKAGPAPVSVGFQPRKKPAIFKRFKVLWMGDVTCSYCPGRKWSLQTTEHLCSDGVQKKIWKDRYWIPTYMGVKAEWVSDEDP
jgi:hypothetical protein